MVNVGVSNLLQANKEAVNKDRKFNHKTFRAHNSKKRWAGRKDEGARAEHTKNTTNARP